MFAPRRIVIFSTVVAVFSALVAGAANAEPKNEWPFTRPTSSRILTQAASSGVVDATPMPEPKNELPFTRLVGGRGLSTAGTSGGGADVTPMPEPKNELPFTRFVGGRGLSARSAPRSSSGAGGTDWPLVGWGLLVAITLVAGALVLRHDAWSRARNHPA